MNHNFMGLDFLSSADRLGVRIELSSSYPRPLDESTDNFEFRLRFEAFN